MIKDLLVCFLPQDLVGLIIWEYTGIVPTNLEMKLLHSNVVFQLRKLFVIKELKDSFLIT